jgi:hypothetical protein
MSYKSFRGALQLVLGGLHDLIDLVVRVKTFEVANQIITLYLTTQNLSAEIERTENEERLLKSFYNAVSLLDMGIQCKQDTNAIIQLVAMLVRKLRTFYTELVMRRYKIDRGLF